MTPKDSKGKPDWSLLDPTLLEELIKAYQQGVDKYYRNSWREGMSYNACYASAQRHINAFMKGEDLNLDDGIRTYHLANAAWWCLTLLYYRMNGLGVDDRVSKMDFRDSKMQDKIQEASKKECKHKWKSINGSVYNYVCEKCDEVFTIRNPDEMLREDLKSKVCKHDWQKDEKYSDNYTCKKCGVTLDPAAVYHYPLEEPEKEAPITPTYFPKFDGPLNRNH